MTWESTVRGWGRLWPAFVLIFTAGCDGSIGVRGRILDAHGEPILAAATELGRSEDSFAFEAKTGASGCFELGGLVAPGERDYLLTVSAPGYKPFEGTFRSVGEYAVLVHLAAEEAGTASAVNRLSTEEPAPELHACAAQWTGPGSGDVQTSAPPPHGLPSFEDYPATEVFTGDPAEVDLDSHPDANTFRTALTRDAEVGAKEARFAGHYRIVVIGCGTSCKEVWAVDLVDGGLESLFTASYSVAFRPDSRLIIENDPAAYESLLEEMRAAEVEEIMETYGPPRFWVETGGEFEQIGPKELRIDRDTGKVTPAAQERGAASWRCANDLEVSCGDGACQAETGDAFTPMSVEVDESGAMSVCAYSGCWEGSGEVVESGEFLVLTGQDLEFSTSRDSESARADILVAIDRADGVGTLKAAEFALPLLCKAVED